MIAAAEWPRDEAERTRVLRVRCDGAFELVLADNSYGRIEAGSQLALTDDESRRLASVLDAPFAPSPALRASLARLADPHRAPPRVRWPRSGA